MEHNVRDKLYVQVYPALSCDEEALGRRKGGIHAKQANI